jgi:hypothetical protein
MSVCGSSLLKVLLNPDELLLLFQIYDASGTPQYSLFGNYMDRIYACPEACTTFDVDSPDVRLLWKAPQLIEDYHQQYCFTRFTLGLNRESLFLFFNLGSLQAACNRPFL